MKGTTATLRVVEVAARHQERPRRLAKMAIRSMAVSAALALLLLPHEISHYICLTFCGGEFLRMVWHWTR